MVWVGVGQAVATALRGGLGLTCVLGLALVAPAASRAETATDHRRVNRDLATTEAQLETLTERARQAVLDLSQASAALPPAQATLELARGRVFGAQAAARQADREAAAAKAAAATAAAAFDQAAAAVRRARDEVSSFVSAAYRGRGFAAFNAVLESGSPSDLATSVGYLNRAADAKRRALARLTAARMVAKQRSDQADATRDLAAAAARRAEAVLYDALAVQAAAERAAAAVQTLVDQRSTASTVIESERGAVLARYHMLKAESERIAGELRAAALLQQPPANPGAAAARPAGPGPGSTTAALLAPVNGWRSSDFGMRFDPCYHVWQLHAGTDFAAPGGAPITAAAAGRVVRASWNGGYGNYTCLYHGISNGRGLSTCYAHQSAILVRPNQWVEPGQIIGRVGTTGASTGHHLHFEVRVDGAPVNPLGWLG